MQRDHVALRQQRVDGDEFDSGMPLRASVPGQHAQAAAQCDARDLRGDAAEAYQT